MYFLTLSSRQGSHEGERKMNDKKSRAASSMPRGFEKQTVDDVWKPMGRRGAAVHLLVMRGFTLEIHLR